MGQCCKFAYVDGFGDELDEIDYEGLSNWFVSFRSVMSTFGGHFSYFVIHVAVITCGILTLKHAMANGQRYIQFWWGALIHGILSENVFSTTKYWHAQALIMLFGKRLPLHMVFFYPTLLYLSMIAIHKYRLSTHTEPVAVGLHAMMMEIPFRIVSVKFLHITYHDTDPMYASKFYGVPWSEILCALVFASSYVGNYYALKSFFLSKDHIKWERAEFEKKDAIMTLVSGLTSPLIAFLQKVIFFHVLQDSFNVNPQTCLMFLCTLYFSIVFCNDKDKGEDDDSDQEDCKGLLYIALSIFLGSLLYISIAGRPEDEVSVGVHEPTGDCTTLICSRTPLGKEFKRRKYLCTDDISKRQDLYNFACLANGAPRLSAVWYTICGTPFANRNEFKLIITIFQLMIITLFKPTLLKETFYYSKDAVKNCKDRTIDFIEKILEKQTALELYEIE